MILTIKNNSNYNECLKVISCNLKSNKNFNVLTSPIINKNILENIENKQLAIEKMNDNLKLLKEAHTELTDISSKLENKRTSLIERFGRLRFTENIKREHLNLTDIVTDLDTLNAKKVEITEVKNNLKNNIKRLCITVENIESCESDLKTVV